MIKKPRPEEEEGPADNFPENPEEMNEPEGEAEGMESEAPNEQEEEAAEGEPAGAPEMDQDEQTNVSPEEQQQYDRFVDNCYAVIYDQKTLPKILKSLDATDDPIMNLANTIVQVVHFVATSAKGAQQQISGDVLIQGGAEVMGDLADLAGKVGIHEYSEDEIEGATYRAMDMYRELQKQDGTLDVNAAKQDMRDIMVADKEGRLGELLPGVDERYGVKQPPQGAEPPAEQPTDEEEA